VDVHEVKLLAIALIAAGSAIAQCSAPNSIQITGPINALSGVMTGTIDLQLDYTIPGNPPVVQSEFELQVIAGAMSVCLPPGAFVANYALPKPAPLAGTTHFTRYWLVPSTGGPYAVSSIECTSSLAGCGIVTYIAVPSWGAMTPALWANLTRIVWGNLHP
jgi:hypothetical protein